VRIQAVLVGVNRLSQLHDMTVVRIIAALVELSQLQDMKVVRIQAVLVEFENSMVKKVERREFSLLLACFIIHHVT